MGSEVQVRQSHFDKMGNPEGQRVKGQGTGS